jgi:uncharacterized protein (UPF0335 family)
MAEFEKPGFKFPDEGTEVFSKEDEPKINIEIEIEDDRPEEDRVDPLPQSVKEELYDDELTDYSAKVKKKLLQMKKLAHDERREKDAAMREQQEALAFAQRVVEENKKLKSHLNENEKSILQTVSKTVEMEMEQAKRSYREAYESGDTERMLEAQQKLTEISFKQEKVKNFKPTPLQVEEPVVQTRQQTTAPRPDPTAVTWQQDNPWFGQDKVMTGMALALHEQLKDEGVALSSQEYYRRINDTMRHRFPEKFENEEQNESPRTRPSTVVAPATRSTAPKKIRLTQSQMTISKKLGLTPEQYAQAVLKMES